MENHALSGIETHYFSNRVAADLRLRSHGDREGVNFLIKMFNASLIKLCSFYCYFVIYLYITKYSGDQIENNEMGGACSTYG